MGMAGRRRRAVEAPPPAEESDISMRKATDRRVRKLRETAGQRFSRELFVQKSYLCWSAACLCALQVGHVVVVVGR